MRTGTRLRDRGVFKFIRRLSRERPLGLFGLIVLVFFLLVGIFSDFLAPYPANQIDLTAMLQGSSWAHPLGTDNLGRDILSVLIYGSKTSLTIGFAATAVMLVASITLGVTCGYFGGKYDMLVQRVVEGVQCIPSLLLLLMVMSIAGRGTMQLVLTIGISSGIGQSRLIRSSVISIKSNVYLESAEILGASRMRIMLRHVVPNIAPILIVSAATQVGGMILMESSLSFLGMGVAVGVPSWGNMLSQSGRTYMELKPSLAIYPGLALTLTVFGANMFGDSLRDLLDPRLKGGIGSYKKINKKNKKEENV